jgi:hypothetical protein
MQTFSTCAALALAVLAAGASPSRGEPSTSAAARAPARTANWRFSAEGDVTRLALGSLSFHIMARPPWWPRLRLGIGRVGGALPGVFHRVFDPNDGWSVTEQGGAAQAFYHLGDGATSFFAGSYLRFERWEWRRPELPGSDTGSQLFVMPAAGLRWAPAGGGLFIAPWLGLGVSVWDSGAGTVGPHTYDPLRWFPIAAIHVGYET